MEQAFTGEQQKLTALQIELLKGLKYLTTEKQIEDVRRLLSDYFAQQLDAAIEKIEAEKRYTNATYNQWAIQGKDGVSKDKG